MKEEQHLDPLKMIIAVKLQLSGQHVMEVVHTARQPPQTDGEHAKKGSRPGTDTAAVFYAC